MTFFTKAFQKSIFEDQLQGSKKAKRLTVDNVHRAKVDVVYFNEPYFRHSHKQSLTMKINET